METIIKLSPSELNASLLNKLKKLIGGKTNVDVTISVKEYDAEYAAELDNSIEQAESGQNMVSFSMEEFMAYNPSKTKI
jgi:hypothetical protein